MQNSANVPLAAQAHISTRAILGAPAYNYEDTNFFKKLTLFLKKCKNGERGENEKFSGAFIYTICTTSKNGVGITTSYLRLNAFLLSAPERRKRACHCAQNKAR
jgi:hypothetical protein